MKNNSDREIENLQNICKEKILYLKKLLKENSSLETVITFEETYNSYFKKYNNLICEAKNRYHISFKNIMEDSFINEKNVESKPFSQGIDILNNLKENSIKLYKDLYINSLKELYLTIEEFENNTIYKQSLG